MRVMADNDVGGALTIIRHILQSAERAEYTALVGLEFPEFEALGLSRAAPDRTVWQVCQAGDVVLVTGNRAGGGESLDGVIRELSDASRLPVMTIADVQRLLRDPAYAEAAALRLLGYVERIDSVRGTGRLYVP